MRMAAPQFGHSSGSTSYTFCISRAQLALHRRSGGRSSRVICAWSSLCASASRRANIYSDSELIVRQITGEYRVKSPDLQPLHDKAQRLLLQLESWQIKHLPREENKRADQLVNKALDAKRDVTVSGGSTAAGDEPAQEPSDAEQVHWAVQLMSEKGKSCPLGCPSGERFVFGAQTPAGLCVHAAEAVFKNLQNSRVTRCGHCGLRVRVDAGPVA